MKILSLNECPSSNWNEDQWSIHRANLAQRIAFVGFEPETVDDVFEFVSQYGRKKNKNLIGFSWDISISNTSVSHSAPFGGSTNWSHRRDSLPKDYPGFAGRVWYAYKPGDRRSHATEGSGFYSGTGGYGGYDGPWEKVRYADFLREEEFYKRNKKYPNHIIDVFGYDCRWFLIDFPKVKTCIEKQKTWARLSDETNTEIRSSKTWESEEVNRIREKLNMIDCHNACF